MNESAIVFNKKMSNSLLFNWDSMNLHKLTDGHGAVDDHR